MAWGVRVMFLWDSNIFLPDWAWKWSCWGRKSNAAFFCCTQVFTNRAEIKTALINIFILTIECESFEVSAVNWVENYKSNLLFLTTPEGNFFLIYWNLNIYFSSLTFGAYSFTVLVSTPVTAGSFRFNKQTLMKPRAAGIKSLLGKLGTSFWSQAYI